MIASFVRMFEPKILQVTVDTLTSISGKGDLVVPTADFATRLIYSFIPSLEDSSLLQILLSIGAIFLVISLLRGLTTFFSGIIKAAATEKAIKRLRDGMFKHIQRLPIEFHDTNKTGELIQRSTGDVDTVRRFMLDIIVEMLRLLGIFFAALYFMLQMHVTLALISICIVPVIFISSYLFFKKERKIWEVHEDEADKLTSMVSENLSGIRVVQAFEQQDEEIRKFKGQNTSKYNIGIKHNRLHAIFWPFSDLMAHLQSLLAIIFGGYFAINGEISIGEMISFMTYAMMVTWPMQRMGRLVSQTGMAVVAMERIMTIMDAKEEDYKTQEGKQWQGVKLKGNIKFENVSFTYPEGDPVLEDISFEIKAGENIAIVGPAGSGKSSIIKLLMRFYEPSSGKIFLDGKELSEYSKALIRDKLGVVLQKPFLFSDTIANNIAYTKPNAEEREIKQASIVANIDQVMHVFPQGYETFVGEKGVSLSGGQKQRVAIARTILEKPDLLVLDDSTSALDTETEFEIQQALEKEVKGKTSITISHRITSIQYADKIMVIMDGKLQAFGAHAELLEKNSFYKKMYNLQVSIEEDIQEEGE